MRPDVGDRIAIESAKAGMAERRGVVLEVIEADYGRRYRVAWDDGRESIVRPSPGGLRVVESEPGPTGG
jgi:hypothetical protein